MEQFVKELSELLNKHGLVLSGTIRVLPNDRERWSHAEYQMQETISYPRGVVDKTGPFLNAILVELPHPVVEIKGSAPMQISDIEPYQSTIDGSFIGSRSHHRRHLKNNGCIEVGNEMNNAKARENGDIKNLRGDYNVRNELGRAVHQVLNK